MIRLASLIVASLIAALPATAQVKIGLLVSATGPTAAIGVPQKNTGDLLPKKISHADATVNASRSALLIAALTGHPDALLPATDDRLHQPYRAGAMLESAALVARLREAGMPAVISGAGPSVLVLARHDVEAKSAMAQAPPGWGAERLGVDTLGGHIVR